MKATSLFCKHLTLALMLIASMSVHSQSRHTMSHDVLLDKIKGGWAGQTIGCAYGGPTEFCYRSITIPDDVEIKYPEHHIKFFYDTFPGLFDDVYMDLTFVKVYTEEGLDASAESMAKAFAYAPYPLWHANQQARYNIMQGLMPPESGFWKNNPHADCIDFEGIGITIYGNIDCPDKTYEAQLEVTIDGKKDRIMTLCSDFNKRTADCLYWNYDLKNGKHRIEFRLLNPRKDVNIKANRIIYYEKNK